MGWTNVAMLVGVFGIEIVTLFLLVMLLLLLPDACLCLSSGDGIEMGRSGAFSRPNIEVGIIMQFSIWLIRLGPWRPRSFDIFHFPYRHTISSKTAEQFIAFTRQFC